MTVIQLTAGPSNPHVIKLTAEQFGQILDLSVACMRETHFDERAWRKGATEILGNDVPPGAEFHVTDADEDLADRLEPGTFLEGRL